MDAWSSIVTQGVQRPCGERPAWEAALLSFWERAIGYRRIDKTLSTVPFQCPLEEAQDWCNFVVLRPQWLPEGCRPNGLTVRPETLQHSASLVMSFSDEVRAFRLKQFHFDWWVPTSSDANLTAPGKPFTAAGIVGYAGRDYKARQAMCIHRYGALLELAVTAGSFQHEELREFLERLEPQQPDAVAELAALPFALVSYHARKGPGPGPWNYDLMTACQWSPGRELWKRQFEPTRIYYPQWLPPGYRFDSVGTRHEPSSYHWEYQLIFRHGGNLTDNFWIRAVGEETQKLLWIAPGLDRRMGVQLKTVALENRTVRIGSTSEPYGERFAQWIENGVAMEVHARASQHVSQQDFSRFLDSLAVPATD